MTESEIPPEAPDQIGGEFTTELAGTTLEYQYSTGDRYRAQFGEHELQLTPLHGDGHGTFPIAYRARRLRDGLYLVGWAAKPIGLHVTLAIDLAQRTINVSALMPGPSEFFDTGSIHELTPAGERQL